MKKVDTTIIDTAVVPLGDNFYETGLLKSVAGGAVIKAGTVLKRSGDDFAILTNSSSEKAAAVVAFDVKNEKSDTADIAFRALISGRVRADKIAVNGTKATAAELDMLRACSIVPIAVTDLSCAE